MYVYTNIDKNTNIDMYVCIKSYICVYTDMIPRFIKLLIENVVAYAYGTYTCSNFAPTHCPSPHSISLHSTLHHFMGEFNLTCNALITRSYAWFYFHMRPHKRLNTYTHICRCVGSYGPFVRHSSSLPHSSTLFFRFVFAFFDPST